MGDKYSVRQIRTAAKYVLLFLLLSILGIMCAFRAGDILRFVGSTIGALRPVIIGFVIAYLLLPAVRFFEKKVLVRMTPKHSARTVRLLSVMLVFLLMFIIILLAVLLLVPQLISNYTELAKNGEKYIQDAQNFVDSFIGGSDLFGESNTLSELLGADLDVYLGNLLVDSLLFADKLLSSVVALAGGLIDVATTTVFSFICAFGIMLYSERIVNYISRVSNILLKPRYVSVAKAAVNSVDRAFGGFFSGRIFESLIVGAISLVVFYVIRMPYAPLLAVLMSVFNLIPYFGSIFAGVVGGVIVLFADPSKLVLFLAVDLIMEQIDGNILAPRVLGDTIGMHPLCIIVSITVMGSLLGIAGLIVGVPIAAVIIEAVKYLCSRAEQKKNKLPDDAPTDIEKEITEECEVSE